MTPLDREPLFELLTQCQHSGWAGQLREHCRTRFDVGQHGMLPQWLEALEQLPEVYGSNVDGSQDAVRVTGSPSGTSPDQLRSLLMQFHPWRKGPFEFAGLSIDTEWRSDLKWQRLEHAVEFRGRSVLDVGCGNGYYGWRMLSAGADLVVGLDPFLLYVLQFEVFRRYWSGDERHFVLPLSDTDLTDRLEFFDTACSMGVLYHRTSPIDHLQTLRSALRPQGQLILETLVIRDDAETVLVPERRYAKMRNVWFIPSIPMLERWLARTGFRNVHILDVTATTQEEQRRTEWMTFESLEDFLDPADSTRTVEGYPGPVRALVTAERS